MMLSGDSTKDTQLAEICDNKPGEYRSKGREMLVVYRRGKVEGSRSFVVEYKTLDGEMPSSSAALLLSQGYTHVLSRRPLVCTFLLLLPLVSSDVSLLYD